MRTSRATSHRNSLAAGAAVLAAGLVIAACGGSSDVASSTVASTAETTTAPATSSPATTAPTTAAPTTVPPTSAATTTTPTTAPPSTVPVTTAPPATTPTTTAASTPQLGPKPATAFLTADNQLLEVDAATGATIRVLDEFFSGEGIFRGGLRLSPDRSEIWYSEGYEDSWYSCEASVGSWGRVDAADGALELLGSGSGVEPSADGMFVSYLTSGVCVPDPEQPEFWVLTPPDRVVVRELATGEEREFVTDTPPADYAAPSAVSSAIFGPAGNLLVQLGDGRLIDVDPNGSGVIQDHPVVLDEVTGEPVAATGESVIFVDFGDEGSSDVYALDPAGGAPTLVVSAGAFMAVGVSAEGHIAVSSLEPVTVAPGADVTVLDSPGDSFVFDLDW